jgi:hypothetical protein
LSFNQSVFWGIIIVLLTILPITDSIFAQDNREYSSLGTSYYTLVYPDQEQGLRFGEELEAPSFEKPFFTVYRTYGGSIRTLEFTYQDHSFRINIPNVRLEQYRVETDRNSYDLLFLNEEDIYIIEHYHRNQLTSSVYYDQTGSRIYSLQKDENHLSVVKYFKQDNLVLELFFEDEEWTGFQFYIYENGILRKSINASVEFVNIIQYYDPLGREEKMEVYRGGELYQVYSFNMEGDIVSVMVYASPNNREILRQFTNHQLENLEIQEDGEIVLEFRRNPQESQEEEMENEAQSTEDADTANGDSEQVVQIEVGDSNENQGITAETEEEEGIQLANYYEYIFHRFGQEDLRIYINPSGFVLGDIRFNPDFADQEAVIELSKVDTITGCYTAALVDYTNEVSKGEEIDIIAGSYYQEITDSYNNQNSSQLIFPQFESEEETDNEDESQESNGAVE